MTPDVPAIEGYPVLGAGQGGSQCDQSWAGKIWQEKAGKKKQSSSQHKEKTLRVLETLLKSSSYKVFIEASLVVQS